MSNDGRQKNAKWLIHRGSDGNFGYEGARLAVLMDIRDELQTMNQRLSVLECIDFLRIPKKLDRIGLAAEKILKK